MQNPLTSVLSSYSGISTLLTPAFSDSLKNRLPDAGKQMPKRIFSIFTIFSMTAILSRRVMVYHVSSNSFPGTRSIIMYSEPTLLDADELQSKILGIGRP
jgi:hypothetical protein